MYQIVKLLIPVTSLAILVHSLDWAELLTAVEERMAWHIFFSQYKGRQLLR
jgi:hypothetical protein